MKLIIELDEFSYEHIKQYYESHETVESTYSYIYHGIPLDDVKAEITALRYGSDTYKYAIDDVIEILDNIGKADKSCNTCKNNDDEFSGECYECVKNIQNHYKAESEDKE